MSPFNIEEDNKDLQKMVHAAKYDDWDTTFDILYQKPYLVNCIPEHRSWGILHQAVYWNNLSAVTRILNQETCDAEIKTRKSRDGLMPAKSTAIDIADKMKDREQVKKKIIENINNERWQRFSKHITYKVSRKEGEKIVDHLPLFIKELAIYKETLLDKDKSIQTHLIDILKQIFKSENDNWTEVLHELQMSLYAFDKQAAESFTDYPKPDSEEGFFSKLIQLYTRNWVFREVNEALAKEFEPDYNPSSQDLALGLYAMLFDIVITFWPKLKPTSDETYRGVSNQKGEYIKGQEIMFTSLISSSGSKSTARDFAGSYGTFFMIDNSADAKTRPRSIRDYSDYSEDEYVYAVGAEFRVKEVRMEKSLRVVELELLESCKLCKNP